jgi:dextranase
MTSHPLTGLKSSYMVKERVTVDIAVEGVARVVMRDAWGVTLDATLAGGGAVFEELPEGTHVIAALDERGNELMESFTTIRRDRGEDPVMGFVTSFGAADRAEVLAWLRDLRCTVVQIYDWMDSYSIPLASEDGYQDPLGRPIRRDDLCDLIKGITELGAVAQAYAPVIAADADVADAHPEWRLFRNDGSPQSLGDLLEIMNPGAPGWQRHWIDQYSAAVTALGFTGLHLDTYGYPRAALDSNGSPVDMAPAYASFIDEVRRALPGVTMSFNQVNGVPRSLEPPSSPSFRYVEVWPPNTQWRHLDALLQRSAGSSSPHGDTVAIYPPVWANDGDDALRTAVLSQAVLTTLGANALVWGDRRGALCHPYYVNHHDLSPDHARRVLQWHLFGLRVRDLFKSGVDTSWYELSDENAALNVTDTHSVSPEPVGGSLYARVRRCVGWIVVSLMDLTGSRDGSWSSTTAAGTGRDVDVSVLVERPDHWSAEVAVLGRSEGRFTPLDITNVAMREGRGLRLRVPLVDGWSVVRLREGEVG